MTEINLIQAGGFGDLLLGFRLAKLLSETHRDFFINHNCCCRDETWKMVETVFPEMVTGGQIKRLPEHFVNENLDTQEKFDKFKRNTNTYLIWPDLLFRSKNSPPLKNWNISNFLVKQTRCLLGKWRPENYISMAVNSITKNYTYHSVTELAYKLCKEFPNHRIFLPLLTTWNQKDVPKFNFPNPPDNLEIEINLEFKKVYDILCRSEYTICTDNAILHILDDMAAPYLLLDPQFNKSAFESRWRAFGDYHSVPISSLVDVIINVVKTQILIPETQMIGVDKIFRQDKIWSQELIFKE